MYCNRSVLKALSCYPLYLVNQTLITVATVVIGVVLSLVVHDPGSTGLDDNPFRLSSISRTPLSPHEVVIYTLAYHTSRVSIPAYRNMNSMVALFRATATTIEHRGSDMLQVVALFLCRTVKEFEEGGICDQLEKSWNACEAQAPMAPMAMTSLLGPGSIKT